MEKIIQANELTKVYGKANEKQTEALKGISFDIEKGEFIGIMGASGSGKSTLLNILSTLDHPTKGAIRINNSDITKLKGDALADFRLSITHILDKYPAAISGGQKQRVAAARALITEPTILFADEPTGALDSKSAKDLLNMMDDLNTNDQVSILLVTHDPLSASYCQRILFIKDGKIHQEVKREDQSREAFYRQILVILGNLEQ